MPTIGIQTQQFLSLLGYQDKLTALYQRIKSYQMQKQQLIARIQYLQYKNKTLENSLFQQQIKNKQKQILKNQVLLHDVIGLEQQILKQTKLIKKHNSQQQSKKNSLQLKQKLNQKQVLVTIRQQPEPFSPAQTSKTILNRITIKSNKQNSNTFMHGNNQNNGNQLVQRIMQLEKQIQKYEKNKRIMDVQIKRLRKLNEEYSNKCKRLEKLSEARAQLYSNFSTQLNIDQKNISNSGHGLFEFQEQDSLFQ